MKILVVCCADISKGGWNQAGFKYAVPTVIWPLRKYHLPGRGENLRTRVIVTKQHCFRHDTGSRQSCCIIIRR